MVMTDYPTLLKTLRSTLEATPEIQIDELYIAFGASSKQLPAHFPESIKTFYKKLSGFDLTWNSPRFPNEIRINGRARILPPQDLDSDWKEVLWFDHTPADDPIRQFRILDFFSDDACVGFYDKEEPDNQLYFYDFDGEPLGLQVDMAGYIELLCAARGFRYWQLVLHSFLEKPESPEVKTFNTYMPQLFPDFSLEDFRKLYERLKINNTP